MLFEKYRLTTLPPTEFARFVLDAGKCTGCGRCVAACPIQLLELHRKKPRPNERYDAFRCITCQNCVAVCPEGAAAVEGDYRVPRGYWKNVDLYAGGKTLPEPLPGARGRPFEEYEKELTETERVIYRRRSVRLFKKKQVPAELVRRVVEAGRFAPSAGNNQPWKFIVIQDRKLIAEIDEKCKKSLKLVPYASLPAPWWKKATPGNRRARLAPWQKALLPLLVGLTPGSVEPRVRGGVNTVTSDPDYDIFLGAPTLVILLADRRGIGSIELDTGICAQNMVLAAHSLGLGACYIGLIEGLILHPSMMKKLGIEYPFKIVTSLVLGYPKGQVDNVVKRERARIAWFG